VFQVNAGDLFVAERKALDFRFGVGCVHNGSPGVTSQRWVAILM
jgi:hypothetical protein